MSAPDYISQITAVRASGVDAAVGLARWVEDDDGAILYLRLLTDLPDTGGEGLELIDGAGNTVATCPDVEGGIPAGGEVEVPYGGASSSGNVQAVSQTPVEAAAQPVAVDPYPKAPDAATTDDSDED